MPRTAGISELVHNYFAAGWHRCDIRAERAVPLLHSGAKVVSDQDLLTPEELRRAELYWECLIPCGVQWFAVVGFRSGASPWGLSIQRTPREGPFEAEEKSALAPLSQRLTEAATLSQVVGRGVIAGMTDALDLVRQGALALDRMGLVLAANAAAQALFDNEMRVRERRLMVRDRHADAELAALIDRLRAAPDIAALSAPPIVVRRDGKPSLLILLLPIAAAARSPFLGTRALLLLSELQTKSGPEPALVARAFGLTPAEARLAALLATGMAPEAAAQRLGITREIARTQLKAAFAKTETHRQSELAALLARLI
ncbi:MAG TPA: helix-turn-helix transcriptional regulator [Stellaceae bacterium]|nr:helix-turn-helix transcriptional regulator [Stellaceae bacterium]